jgi:hypothetical protein
MRPGHLSGDRSDRVRIPPASTNSSSPAARVSSVIRRSRKSARGTVSSTAKRPLARPVVYSLRSHVPETYTTQRMSLTKCLERCKIDPQESNLDEALP